MINSCFSFRRHLRHKDLLPVRHVKSSLQVSKKTLIIVECVTLKLVKIMKSLSARIVIQESEESQI